jgi:two-component system LytT family response regulator
MIRALLVDDEQPARERLRQLLAVHGDVEVVGEAEDGVQAAERIADSRPTWSSSTSDAQRVGARRGGVLGRPRPVIIRCTATDQCGRRVRVVGHRLPLKPVNQARLAAALDRVRLTGIEGGPRGEPVTDAVLRPRALRNGRALQGRAAGRGGGFHVR